MANHQNKQHDPVTKEELLELPGHFGWDFGKCFFIETSKGNFVWEDPDYGGRNVIYRYNGNLDQWLKGSHVPYVRDKGIHTIQGYCGSDWQLLS